MIDDDTEVFGSHRMSTSVASWRVAELWRYPVKSLSGERVAAVRVVSDGVDGDRMWGIQDCNDGRILTARREPRLLFASSRLLDHGYVPVITFPDGHELTGLGAATDAALSTWLAKPVRLVSAAESGAARADYFSDATDDASQAIEWTMPNGRLVDAFPVLIMTTAGLRGGATTYSSGTWDVRRFRPNVLIALDGEGWIEDAWAEGNLGGRLC